MQPLNVISNDVIQCTKCNLSLLEINDNKKSELGFGKLIGKEGEQSNEIMIVGLNPSYNRFVGLQYPFDASLTSKVVNPGTMFIVMLQKINIYQKCYITNLLKCSTSDNQVSNDQLDICRIHFNRELEYCKPKLILACGIQVFNYIKLNYKYLHNIEKIYHPSFCFSYRKISTEEYVKNIQQILRKYLL